MKKETIILLLFLPLIVFAQEDSTLVKKSELILQEHFNSLSIRKSDKLQDQINYSIIDEFKKIMLLPFSFSYEFDSLKTMGKITSEDEKLGIYSWNTPYEDGSQRISGIIQYKVEKDSFRYIILNDQSYDIENPENSRLTPENWLGAMYYEIIEKKVDKHKYYFLLGYNPGNLFSNKKIIDVFYFDEYGYPFFGKPFFVLNNKKQSRVIIEYNERASVTLHYNKKKKMIIFHHLVPIDYKYANNPAFYGPDFTFDGFEFKEDLWNLVEQVDVRNENY